MNDIQKEIARQILDDSYRYGFNYISLELIANDLRMKPDDIFNFDTETGHLAEFTQKGKIGLFYVKDGSIAIMMDTLDLLENWIK